MFLLRLHAGTPGAQGPPGADGAEGPPGSDGLPGSDGSNGTNGIDGTNGADGDKGDKGDKGDTGEPGFSQAFYDLGDVGSVDLALTIDDAYHAVSLMVYLPLTTKALLFRGWVRGSAPWLYMAVKRNGSVVTSASWILSYIENSNALGERYTEHDMIVAVDDTRAIQYRVGPGLTAGLRLVGY